MNHLLIKILSVLCLISSAAWARVDESGPGNGTDYVKVLFADAQYDVLRQLTSVEDKDIAQLGVDSEIKTWLLAPIEGSTRLQKLKFYLRKMDLAFQPGPCSDSSGKPASICFFQDAEGPFVKISLEENKVTLKEQAMAMLIHEAGHFTGEKNHLFLDKVGVQLVGALRLPKLLLSEAQSTELVANIFLAKDQCEEGSSRQAEILRKEATTSLLAQCDQKQMSCDLARAQFIYKGVIHYQAGLGFDMKVTCTVRGVLDLR